jgi:hypothetical protein
MTTDIPLLNLNNAIMAATSNASLILDASGNAEVFFKYNGVNIVSLASGMASEDILRTNFKFCCKNGDNFVLVIPPDANINDYFRAGVFPQEIVNYEALTSEFLETFKDNVNDRIQRHKDFRFVVLMNTSEAPAWSENFSTYRIV